MACGPPMVMKNGCKLANARRNVAGERSDLTFDMAR